ncbi:MAG: Mu-like prophage major head subunit gpT family protein [Negativicutes bacterium]|nr:Mu-like prophage major head subunit gpT family protein [Negativicutes bacterium]
MQISELSLLGKVVEGGEYKYQTLKEAGETIQLGKFGDIVSLTREMIINDDLQVFSNILAKFGAVARMNVESAVYELLTANANLSDSVALFEVNTHKNYTSTGTALSVASLGVGRAAMRKQKGLKGKLALNINPAFLIVPVEQSVTAEQLIASTVDPSKSNATPNPFGNKLQVVSCPILDDTSTKSWYLAAAPGYVDTIEVAFLDGNDAPYMETRTGFEVDGIDYKVRYEFGAAVLDYRGLYKNAGA